MKIRIENSGINREYDLDSFQKDVISFGRDSECDIQINSPYVSKLHGCFYKEEDEWFVQDMNSTNGLYYCQKKLSEAYRLNGTKEFYISSNEGKKNHVRIITEESDNKQEDKKDGLAIIRDGNKKTDTHRPMGLVVILLAGLLLVIICTILILVFSKKEGRRKASDESNTTMTDSTGTISVSEATETDVVSDIDPYYSEKSDVISVTKAEESDNVMTGEEVCKTLEERGFTEFEVENYYSISGEMFEEESYVQRDSTDKIPYCQTYYVNSNNELWTIFIIDGAVMAMPVSYNLESELGVQVVFSEKDSVVSYDSESNSFYETIPYESELKVINAGQIDVKLLDKFTAEEIDKYVK